MIVRSFRRVGSEAMSQFLALIISLVQHFFQKWVAKFQQHFNIGKFNNTVLILIVFFTVSDTFSKPVSAVVSVRAPFFFTSDCFF